MFTCFGYLLISIVSPSCFSTGHTIGCPLYTFSVVQKKKSKQCHQKLFYVPCLSFTSYIMHYDGLTTQIVVLPIKYNKLQFYVTKHYGHWLNIVMYLMQVYLLIYYLQLKSIHLWIYEVSTYTYFDLINTLINQISVIILYLSFESGQIDILHIPIFKNHSLKTEARVWLIM